MKKNTAPNVTKTAIKPDGIRVEGRRYNCRALTKHLGKEVEAWIDDGPPHTAVCFLDGKLLCYADIKVREYDNVISTFRRALDLCPRALLRLQHFTPWHGVPWHVHLAKVLWDIISEPPMLSLPESTTL